MASGSREANTSTFYAFYDANRLPKTLVTFGKLDDLEDLLKSKDENVKIFDDGDFCGFDG